MISPADQLYFDYHQGPGEPGAPWEGNKGGPQSIAKMLAWEPVPDGFTPEESGAGPRHRGLRMDGVHRDRALSGVHDLPAHARACGDRWRPKGPRDEAEFNARLAPHIEALRAKGINARRGEGDAYEFITN